MELLRVCGQHRRSRLLIAAAIITMRNCSVMGSIGGYLVRPGQSSQAADLLDFAGES
jgi:hypothetical protein